MLTVSYCTVSMLRYNVRAVVFATGGIHTNRFLVAATNQTNGVEIRIFPDISSDKDWPSYEQREITGYFLPADCGEKFHKCNQPLVVAANAASTSAKRGQTDQQSFILILPLAKALGFLKLKVNSIGFLSISEEPHIIDLSEQKYNCSPTSVYHIRNSYYVVCPNAASNYVKLLELRLNTTHLEESYLPVLEHPHLESVRSLTNSLYVDLPSESGPVIFFATRYEVFYFRPLQYVIEELDIGLREKECFAKSIEYIGDWEMLIYCDNDQAMYVDMNREFIFTSVEYAKDGRPYICPNPDVYLAIYAKAHYILYAFRSTKQASNFELPGRNFDNGICLGSQNVTLFAFSDRERGTQLLNTSATGSIRSLSGTTCTNYPCQPLVILQDRYLVIREKREGSWFISILDSSKDFSLVLEAQHSNADLMTVIESVGVLEENMTVIENVGVLKENEGKENENENKLNGSKVTPKGIERAAAQSNENEDVIVPAVIVPAVIVPSVVVSAVAVSIILLAFLYYRKK